MYDPCWFSLNTTLSVQDFADDESLSCFWRISRCFLNALEKEFNQIWISCTHQCSTVLQSTLIKKRCSKVQSRRIEISLKSTTVCDALKFGAYLWFNGIKWLYYEETNPYKHTYDIFMRFQKVVALSFSFTY